MTILLLDTSHEICHFFLHHNGKHYTLTNSAGRELSKKIFTMLEDFLGKHTLSYEDIEGIGVFRGPGSYTGLRIGLTVANSLADSLQIPIVGTHSTDWQKKAIERLKRGENDQIVLPEYVSIPHITSPRK
jgi:tRNA threonylcarbamoyladenosine biosynthesis protein TsaB